MRSLLFLILFFILFTSPLYSQFDSSSLARLKSLDTMNILKLDTSEVPNDSFTQKIRELRKEKSGLSIESILQIKIMEEKQKDTTRSKDFYAKLQNELTMGRTSKLIENCMINIYRRSFTEEEVEDLVRFYKTSAGKKMDKEFLFLLVESAKDAEQLLGLAAKKIEGK